MSQRSLLFERLSDYLVARAIVYDLYDRYGFISNKLVIADNYPIVYLDLGFKDSNDHNCVGFKFLDENVEILYRLQKPNVLPRSAHDCLNVKFTAIASYRYDEIDFSGSLYSVIDKLRT